MFNFFRKKTQIDPNAPMTAKQMRNKVRKRGEELAEITKQRNGGKQPALAREDMRIAIYLFGNDWDSIINKAGLDFPVMDRDDSLKTTLLKEGYFPVHESLFIHSTFLKNIDIEHHYLYVEDDFENKMTLNLRDRDIIERLNGIRVKGIPGCYQIDMVYLEQVRAIIEDER